MYLMLRGRKQATSLNTRAQQLRGLGMGLTKASAKLAFYIAAYITCSAIVHFIFAELSLAWEQASSYKPYADLGLAVAFGYLIVNSISEIAYWSLRVRYEHPTAVAVRNVVRLLGLGALAATIAGSKSTPAAGVALGGFMGMVIGFATQQVLGQAVAGLFLLVARPFMIGEKIDAGGEKGTVEDITIMFTVLRRDDGNIVMLPNNKLVGAKIVKIRPAEAGSK